MHEEELNCIEDLVNNYKELVKYCSKIKSGKHKRHHCKIEINEDQIDIRPDSFQELEDFDFSESCLNSNLESQDLITQKRNVKMLNSKSIINCETDMYRFKNYDEFKLEANRKSENILEKCISTAYNDILNEFCPNQDKIILNLFLNKLYEKINEYFTLKSNNSYETGACHIGEKNLFIQIDDHADDSKKETSNVNNTNDEFVISENFWKLEVDAALSKSSKNYNQYDKNQLSLYKQKISELNSKLDCQNILLKNQEKLVARLSLLINDSKDKQKETSTIETQTESHFTSVGNMQNQLKDIIEEKANLVTLLQKEVLKNKELVAVSENKTEKLQFYMNTYNDMCDKYNSQIKIIIEHNAERYEENRTEIRQLLLKCDEMKCSNATYQMQLATLKESYNRIFSDQSSDVAE